MTRILYKTPGDSNWIAEIEDVIGASGYTLVAEIGGGANPTLPLEVIERRGLEYTVYDISEVELGKAHDGYERVVADVTAPGFAAGRTFDLVISRWLLEHVDAPAETHRNVYEALVPGGRAMHFFPTLYSLPFVINRVVPEGLSDRLLRSADDAHAEGRRGKFPALYRWCRGPTARQISRLESTGLEVEEYTGYFGHPYYRRAPRLNAAYERWSRWLVRHPAPVLTSFASVILRRPLS